MSTTVLIVEDEADLRLAVNVLVSSAGYEVTEAASGREALDIVERERPNVIVLDVGLPDMGGLDVLRAVKAMEYVRSKIVMLSAHASGHTAKKAIEMGADDYLFKPFDPAALIETIEGVLR